MPTQYEKLVEMHANRHTKEEAAQEVWDTPTSSLNILGSIGLFLKTKVMTVAKFIGLK